MGAVMGVGVGVGVLTESVMGSRGRGRRRNRVYQENKKRQLRKDERGKKGLLESKSCQTFPCS